MSSDRYGKVYVRTWTDPKFLGMTPAERFSWIYVLTCPEHRSEGLFKVDVRGGARVTGATVEQFETHMELFQNLGMCFWEPEHDLVLLKKALEYEPCKNSNVAKGVVNRLRVLHRHWMIGELLAIAERHDEFLEVELRCYLAEVGTLEPNRNQTGTKPEPDENQTGTKPEHVPEPPITRNPVTRIENTCSSDDERKGPSFASFWVQYPRKQGKARAQKTWQRMSVDNREKAIGRLAQYVGSVADPQFLKHGDTYLSQQTWHDFDPVDDASPEDDEAAMERRNAERLARWEAANFGRTS